MAKTGTEAAGWDSTEVLANYEKRFTDMDAERSKRRSEWEMCDDQYEAAVSIANDGRLISNSPVEQSLIEMEIGRTAGRPTFDVVPDPYDSTPEQAETAKYVLDSFLDREGFVTQLRQRSVDKAKYGTAISYNGIRFDVVKREIRVDPETVEEDVGNGVFDTRNLTEVSKEKWFFTPINVPIRHFWIDDGAFNQPDFLVAVDCIMRESLSLDAFKSRFRTVKAFDQDVVENATLLQDVYPEYGVSDYRGKVIVDYYFNRITQEYSLIVNKNQVMYSGKMPYKHDRLPFSVAQHYPNNTCIYGYGICRKVRFDKAYKNNLQQALLDGARMSSSKIIGVGSSGEFIDGDLFAAPGAISIARFSNGVQDIAPIDTNVNINGLSGALSYINEEIRVNTGIDLRAPFEPPAPTLGQTEIIEENKAVRQKAIDEARDIALDDMLTQTLSNIAQFAPVLLRREIKKKGKDGELDTVIYKRPTIQLRNVKIEKRKNEIIIEEDYGSYGFLELKPETMTGDMLVRIITPTTYNRILSVIEKNKYKELVGNYVELAQVL